MTAHESKISADIPSKGYNSQKGFVAETTFDSLGLLLVGQSMLHFIGHSLEGKAMHAKHMRV